MREIKFRARDRNNKWVYGTGIVQVEHNTYDTDKWELVQKVNYDELDNYYPSYETEEIDIKTLGQYTETKDKNGKEIYEGDILKFKMYDGKYENYKIVFRNAEFEAINEEDTNFISTDIWNVYGEVIGNIYENPELLEDKE